MAWTVGLIVHAYCASLSERKTLLIPVLAVFSLYMMASPATGTARVVMNADDAVFVATFLLVITVVDAAATLTIPIIADEAL